MATYKVKSKGDSDDFVVTNSFKILYRALHSLKIQKGRFINVIGAPGTGKSANIYYALNILDLNVYDPMLFLDNVEISSGDVFREFFNTLKDDLDVSEKGEVYKKVSEFDTILFADNFLDSEFLDAKKVGLSMWTEYKGLRSYPFYFLCILEYLKHKKDLKKVNVIVQLAWMIKISDVKYDLLTDFSFLSKILVFILKQFVEVVKISYSHAETIKIVKSQFKDVDEKQIELCIKRYGCKPRLIFEALENDHH
jgi:hypothetical protein